MEGWILVISVRSIRLFLSGNRPPEQQSISMESRPLCFLRLSIRSLDFWPMQGHSGDRLFGFLPGPRFSSAYGFAQVLDATWQNYITQTGHQGADRAHFPDAVDFVGWYLSAIATRGRIPVTDGYRLYLAYHEGYRGYLKGSWRRKKVLINAAKRVAKPGQNNTERGMARCR